MPVGIQRLGPLRIPHTIRCEVPESRLQEVSLDYFVENVLFGLLSLGPREVAFFQHHVALGVFEITLQSEELFGLAKKRIAAHLQSEVLKDFTWSSSDGYATVVVQVFTPHVATEDLATFLKRYCSEVRDGAKITNKYGLWMGRRRFRVRFRTREDGSVVYPPYSFFLGPDKGFLFIEGQPGACWRCGAVGHRMVECEERRCRYCGQSGHESGACAAPKSCSLCGSHQHLFRECPQRSRRTAASESNGGGSVGGAHGEPVSGGVSGARSAGALGEVPAERGALEVPLVAAAGAAEPGVPAPPLEDLAGDLPCGQDRSQVPPLQGQEGSAGGPQARPLEDGSGGDDLEASEGVTSVADGVHQEGVPKASYRDVVLGISEEATRVLEGPPAVMALPALGPCSSSGEDSVLEEEMPESRACVKRTHPGGGDPTWRQKGRRPEVGEVDPEKEGRLNQILKEAIGSEPGRPSDPKEVNIMENWLAQAEKEGSKVLEEAAEGVCLAAAGAAGLGACAVRPESDPLFSSMSAESEEGARESSSQSQEEVGGPQRLMRSAAVAPPVGRSTTSGVPSGAGRVAAAAAETVGMEKRAIGRGRIPVPAGRGRLSAAEKTKK